MPDQQVQPLAQRLVEGRLEVVPERLLPVRADGGEAFGQHEPAAVGVRGRGGLLDEEPVGRRRRGAATTRPRTRDIGTSLMPRQRWASIGTACGPPDSGWICSPCLCAPVAERAVMVVDRQVAEGLAEIVQEPVADRAAVHDPAGQDRQEGQQVVAAPLAELLAQRGRPVDRLDLPTVGVQILQRAPGQRPGVGDQRLDHRVPVTLRRRPHRARPARSPASRRCTSRRGNGRRWCSRTAGPATRLRARPSAACRPCEQLGRQVQHLGGARVLLAGFGGHSSNSGVVSGAEKCSGLCIAFCSQFWIGYAVRTGGIGRGRAACLSRYATTAMSR